MDVTIGPGSKFSWPIVVALISLAATGAVALAQGRDVRDRAAAIEARVGPLEMKSAVDAEQHRQMLQLLQDLKSEMAIVRARK